MSMKKKLKIGGALLLVAAAAAIICLVYRARAHQASLAKEGQAEKIAATVTPTPEPEVAVPQETAAPTLPATGAEAKAFEKFKDNLSGMLDEKQAQELKKETAKYLENSSMHTGIVKVTCTEYHYRSQKRNQVYGYLQLDDGSLLQYTYDFDRSEVKLMETSVTMKELKDKKNQEEAAGQARKQQEEEKKKKEELARKLFEETEGDRAGSNTAPAQVQQGSHPQSSSGRSTAYPYPSQTAGAEDNGNLDEETQKEQILEGGDNLDRDSAGGDTEENTTDAEAIFEEEISEPAFKDE